METKTGNGHSSIRLMLLKIPTRSTTTLETFLRKSDKTSLSVEDSSWSLWPSSLRPCSKQK